MKYVLFALGVVGLGFLLLGVVNPYFESRRHQSVSIAAGGPAGTIAGRVVSWDGEPLGEAFVIIEGTDMGNSTDGEGRYTITDVPPGNYELTVACSGYKDVTVKATLKPAVGLLAHFVLSP